MPMPGSSIVGKGAADFADDGLAFATLLLGAVAAVFAGGEELAHAAAVPAATRITADKRCVKALMTEVGRSGCGAVALAIRQLR